LGPGDLVELKPVVVQAQVSLVLAIHNAADQP
jgi:hypothetical protein